MKTLHDELHELDIITLRRLGGNLAIPKAWSTPKTPLVEAIMKKADTRHPALTGHMHWGDWYVAGVIVR